MFRSLNEMHEKFINETKKKYGEKSIETIKEFNTMPEAQQMQTEIVYIHTFMIISTT